MGYYTAYSLTLRGEDEKVKAFEKGLLEYTKDSEGHIDGDIEELIESGGTYAKQYDLLDQITEVAKDHPDVLVILYGDGEDSDDNWEARWKGDKYEFQKAVIPPFQTPELQ